MTWRTYAVVSGATALATWLASSAPTDSPANGGVVQAPPAAAIAPAAATIEDEASRLQARLPPSAAYHEPERNPFRFSAPSRPAYVPPAASGPEPYAEPLSFEPPPPVVSLAGIAEERTGEQVERTAILTSPAGVLLVREGDSVLGQYRVGRVEGGAVELETLADGSTLRLTLRP